MLSAAFGVGGAVVSTPGIRLLGASALMAVGTTLPAILPAAVAGSVRYRREGLIDWAVVTAAAPAGAVGAVAGSLVSHAVPGEGHWLMVATAMLIGVTAARLARGRGPASQVVDDGVARPTVPPPTGEVAPPAIRLRAGSVGLVAGVLSGLLGIGGGTLLIPGFVTLLRMPMKTTIATSLACVGILAIPGTLTHALLGHIDWRFALLLAAAVVPGARLGASLTIGASERQLRVAVATVLGLLAVGYFVTELRLALR